MYLPEESLLQAWRGSGACCWFIAWSRHCPVPTKGATCWPPPLVMTAVLPVPVAAIKEAYFLCLVNENHFQVNLSACKGGGGLELDSDVISTVI